MNKSIVLALLGLLAVALTVVLLWPKWARAAGPASVLYAGATKISAGGRLGNGTPEFPYFDLAELHITNVPTSGRVGLFVLTNATFKDVYFNLEAVEVWQNGLWVNQAPDWGRFGWELAPRKSCVQPVPEPAGHLPWRLRVRIREHPRGAKGMLDKATVKTANTVLFPEQSKEIFSPVVLDGRAESHHSADGSQPFTSASNPAPTAAGSHR